MRPLLAVALLLVPVSLLPSASAEAWLDLPPEVQAVVDKVCAGTNVCVPAITCSADLKQWTEQPYDTAYACLESVED